MQQAIIMKAAVKNNLSELIEELFGGEFDIKTYDKEYYIFTDKERPELEYHHHWTELCICHIPEKLGMSYIIIPVNNAHFNLAEHIINYYHDIYTTPLEKGTVAPEGISIIKNLRDIPKALAKRDENLKKRKKEYEESRQMNIGLGSILEQHM